VIEDLKFGTRGRLLDVITPTPLIDPRAFARICRVLADGCMRLELKTLSFVEFLRMSLCLCHRAGGRMVATRAGIVAGGY
jgi:hypothetical protein